MDSKMVQKFKVIFTQDKSRIVVTGELMGLVHSHTSRKP